MVRGLCLALIPLLPLAAPPKELRFSIAGDPKTFDPLHIEESNSQTIGYLTSGVLVKVNRATDQLEPELAESWEIKDSGRTITFHLRAGLKFSDGTPLTAARCGPHPKPRARSQRRLTRRRHLPLSRRPSGSPRHRPARYHDPLQAPKAGLDRIFDQLGITSGFARETSRQRRAVLRRPSTSRAIISASRAIPTTGSTTPPDIRFRISIPSAWIFSRTTTSSSRVSCAANRRLSTASNPKASTALPKKSPPLPATSAHRSTTNSSGSTKHPPKPCRTGSGNGSPPPPFAMASADAIHRDDIARIVYRGHAHPAASPVSTANKFWFNAALKAPVGDATASLKILAAEGFKLRDGVLRDRDGHPVEFSIVTNSGNRPRERWGNSSRATC